MDIFFADDCTQTKPTRKELGKVVGFGGVMVDESALTSLEASVDGICAAFGIPKGTELKWSPGKKNWIRKNLVEAARADCYSQVLRAAAAHEVRAVVVVWATGRTSLKEKAALRKGFEYLFERVSMNLSDRGKKGIIVADRPGGGSKQEVELLSQAVNTIKEGTSYVPAGQVVLNLLTTPSHNLRHIQIADMVVGATTSAIAGETTYAQPMMAEVKPLLIRNSLGYVGGTGLKIVPSDLINLYHWTLGESTFARAATMSGVGLPWAVRPYATDPFVW